MPKLFTFILPIFLLLGFTGPKNQSPVQIELVTNYGTIILQLSDQTPLHRDNFIKLVEAGTYDSLLFHRVIKGFMIQGGDVQGKYADSVARLGSSDLPYQIPAEIVPGLFHKKGALAAARTNNPQRASSSTQFYIVQGKVQNDSLLNHNEGRINQMLARHYGINDPAHKPLIDSLEKARIDKDTALVQGLNTRLNGILANYQNYEKYQISESQREVYKSIGGTPHLDQNYTVFGEVSSGLEVVDSIAAVMTNRQDRPVTEVRILSMRLLTKK
ncbi:peptidyl-prolyl cis-trans isomerase B (cyclophilin B) [Algoriphagus alkaliphilus]|uniref:peptidylprolyl isomerase n=1 Tax=Algoriphagus alkaliphilus TaxID=279824 RepID=A0A1G5VGL8_9BACT|nr:peptidylprolyl isomerase [Algoriphagus alkaliphilus]SDA44357.1 peptidyl-prolyl cis-trans isomerase B (cyclophilin B) [Algoriphagus alkaliphilus]